MIETPAGSNGRQLSPDGLWAWSGTEWIPSQPAPPPLRVEHTAPLAQAQSPQADRHARPPLTAGVVTLVGCGVAILGTFLPWLTATGPFGISVSKAGIEGDGKFVVGLALVCAALAAFVLLRQPASFGIGLLVFLLGLGQLGLVIWVGSNISNAIASIPSDSPLIASIGPGLYMSGLGAIISGVGGIVAWTTMSSTGGPKRSYAEQYPQTAAALETQEERDARIAGRS